MAKDDINVLIKIKDSNTRLKIKSQALKRNMTMIAYIDYLVDKDKKALNKAAPDES